MDIWVVLSLKKVFPSQNLIKELFQCFIEITWNSMLNAQWKKVKYFPLLNIRCQCVMSTNGWKMVFYKKSQFIPFAFMSILTLCIEFYICLLH